MSADISCGKCGEKISTMQTLKSVKDVMKHYNNKCPSCVQVLSTTEFSLDLEKKYVNFFIFNYMFYFLNKKFKIRSGYNP